MIEHDDYRVRPSMIGWLAPERKEAQLVGPGMIAGVWREIHYGRLRQHGTHGYRGVLIKDGWKYQTRATLTKGEALHELFILIEARSR